MDKKKKDQKAAASASASLEANDTHSNEDKNQVDVEKNATMGSSSLDNVASQNQQPQPVFPWPYASLTGVEQPHLIPRPCIPNQSPSPAILTQWHQSQHQQPSFTIHPVQHSEPSFHFGQPTFPFWPTSQACFHLRGPSPNVPSSYRPPAPERRAELAWSGTGASNGGISMGQQWTPSFCYHIGCTYPSFPGPWESSTWWNQAQYFLPHCNSALPGPCNALSSIQPRMPGCSAPSPPRGLIHPPPKLSAKHQQLWEAQSAENIHLWNVIGHLQSELDDFKSRLTKLEADVSTLKPILEEVAAHGPGASPAGQTLKRGRAKRSVVVNETLTSPDASRTRGRGRKPNSTISNGNMVIPGSNDLFQSQIEQDSPGIPITEACLNRSDSKHDHKIEGSAVFSISSQNDEGVEIKNSPANFVGMPTNGNFFWPPTIASGDCGRDMINITAHGLFNTTDITRKERKFVAEWSFGNQDDHSASFEHIVAESTKDENEMDNDGSSDPEDVS